MGSDSHQFKPTGAAASDGPSDRSSAAPDAADMLASIGYEAADPSLQAPHWHETLLGLANRQDRR